jgi:farnesyl diphosphate synthase
MTGADAPDFETVLAARAAEVESCLDRLLGERPLLGEIVRPAKLLAAMRHGVLNGGKRLRPFLVIESGALFDADPMGTLFVAAAIECVHCYSLIHDDLPAMDDDDLRRGQPTVHKAFDEATAILAGDALLTYAFDVVALSEGRIPAAARIDLVGGLARAAGLGGMAGGQMLDLAAEKMPPDEKGIITLQAMKTGALIRFACEAGPIAAGASMDDRERLAEFGSAIGLAFQLADDLLDLSADARTLGKATGKDAAAGKGTFVTVLGMDGAKARLKTLVAESEAALALFGRDADVLKMAARFVAERKA